MWNQLPDYQKALPCLWQGRKDTSEPQRFFEKIQFIKDPSALINSAPKTIFLGFASDTGITRNLGRAGAHLGPDDLKKQLAKLPCFDEQEYIDLGSILCKDNDLESAQKQFAELISFCHHNGHKTIGFGGGHEIAWGHFQGLSPHYPKLGIINFDAHFDLRPHANNEPGTSGTPFTQIASLCEKNQLPFNYCCIGIQSFGNTSSLFERAQKHQVNYLSAAQVNQLSLTEQLAFLDTFILQQEHIYLTLCLDVLAECFAPGVSAPQPLGLTPWQILPLLKHIIKSKKVVSMDIAELSPPLDQEQKTARLAALIVAELLDTCNKTEERIS